MRPGNTLSIMLDEVRNRRDGLCVYVCVCAHTLAYLSNCGLGHHYTTTGDLLLTGDI